MIQEERLKAHEALHDFWHAIECEKFKMQKESHLTYSKGEYNLFFLNVILTNKLELPSSAEVDFVNNFNGIIEKFKAKNRGNSLYFPDSFPNHIVGMLEKAGMVNFGTVRSQVIHAPLPLDKEKSHIGDDVHFVDSESILREWIDVFKQGFELSEEAASEFSDLLNASNKKGVYHLLYREKGQPTSALSLYLTSKGRVGNFSNFVTLPEKRKKGHLSSLLKFTLNKFSKKGVGSFYVQSNVNSENLCRQLGFKDVSSYTFMGKI
jgi:hypothetical protein